MPKNFTTALSLLAAGILILGDALAQTTPPAKTPASPTANAKARRAPTAKSAAAPPLLTQKDKFSYALGMNLGATLHRQSVPVDPNILARGLKDALAGGKTQLHVTAAHPMDGLDHFIVKHQLLDKDLKFLQEHLFKPTVDKKPEFTFDLGNHKGVVYALSVCNVHDMWVNMIEV